LPYKLAVIQQNFFWNITSKHGGWDAVGIMLDLALLVAGLVYLFENNFKKFRKKIIKTVTSENG
jgi:hypothetical protein